MGFKRWSMGFVLAPLLLTLSHTACDDWACGYGGPGCSAPVMGGLCQDALVVGEEYIVIFGYGSDTGISEAKIKSAVSEAPDVLEAFPTPGAPDVPYETNDVTPFDLNNGAGDGGVTLRPIKAGEANITIKLEGWEEKTNVHFVIIDRADAPEGFMSMSASDRLAQCIHFTKRSQ